MPLSKLVHGRYFLLKDRLRLLLDAVCLFFEARGSMLIDIGEGTADMGIISLGGTVISRTIRFGGMI